MKRYARQESIALEDQGNSLFFKEENPWHNRLQTAGDVDFVLHEQFNVEALSEHELFADFNKKTVDMVVSEARNLAIKELLPHLKEADEQGCIFDNGKVTVPEVFHRAYELFSEGEWIAMCDDPEWGWPGNARHRGPGSQQLF